MFRVRDNESTLECLYYRITIVFFLQEIGIYYPADNQELKKGLIEVKCGSVKSEQCFAERKLKISHRSAVSVSTAAFE